MVAFLCFGSYILKSNLILGSGYFAIWRQNSPNGYFAASAKLPVP